jgi:arylsulfatase A-like enzyme
MFGKWGLGPPGSVSDPAVHFDEFYGYNCQRQAHTYYPGHLWHNRQKVVLDNKTYSPDLIGKAALDFIRANKDRPFFCYIPSTIPHAAMHAPKELHDKYRKQFPQFEKTIGEYRGPDVQNPIAAFPAMIEVLDNAVGDVMRLLKELGIDGNTLVMFSSDNGPHHEGGHDPEFWNSNGPFSGLKRDFTEGGIRVPMLARWPGKIKRGTVSNHISAFWDMLPTFMDIAGGETPKPIDGISMLPTLLGQDDKQQQHEYLFWQQGGFLAVRTGRWKAHRTGAGEEMRLYDLETDVGEKKDVAGEHPDVVAAIGKMMAEAVKAIGKG